MSKIEEESLGKKEGEIRYLTPLNIDTIVLALNTFIKSPQLRLKKAEKSYELANNFLSLLYNFSK